MPRLTLPDGRLLRGGLAALLLLTSLRQGLAYESPEARVVDGPMVREDLGLRVEMPRQWVRFESGDLRPDRWPMFTTYAFEPEAVSGPLRAQVSVHLRPWFTRDEEILSEYDLWLENAVLRRPGFVFRDLGRHTVDGHHGVWTEIEYLASGVTMREFQFLLPYAGGVLEFTGIAMAAHFDRHRAVFERMAFDCRLVQAEPASAS